MMTSEQRISLNRAEDAHERRAIGDIRDYGVHILHVFDSEGVHPRFSYTVGLWHRYAHPEVIIFGLSEELCHAVLNDLNRDILGGQSYRAGQSATEVLEGFRCYFEAIPSQYFKEFFGWDLWFYEGDHFEAVQMIWPNTKGIFPWDARASEELKWLEPLLTKPPLLVK